MKVIKLAAVIDNSGNLHLDIPTELSSGTVDVVVVVNPSTPDTYHGKSYDFSDLAGRLSWEGDSVTQTRILRNEW
ncbi:hypothetical protein [Rivularia sp. UHCC 0363]|uniref:hypothetical protein n=1 Tax=Rivularia sp. UHCC 0363 TaxID=3110244 RepID=UPI002B1ED39A|nr:hypothetical protein [Rivularia sp. UHCC 0363]MEA5594632.1 hypothetical protein [Rivularia sp. UHCC 0363]